VERKDDSDPLRGRKKKSIRVTESRKVILQILGYSDKVHAATGRTRTYLDAVIDSLQQPIEGRSVLACLEPKTMFGCFNSRSKDFTPYAEN
jgi:hypothetical protein